MGNLESALGKINVAQLQNPHSRFLDLSRSLSYEQYQEVRAVCDFILPVFGHIYVSVI